MSSAASRLHIVVMSREELAEQEERDRSTVSFAVDRETESPGFGRIAVIVTQDDRRNPAISHLGVVKAGPARTNLDSTWVLSAARAIGVPIKLTDLSTDLGSASDVIRRAASRRRGGPLPGAASTKLREAIRSRIEPGEWPSTGGTPEWMLARVEDEIRRDHTNAVGTALMFSDMALSSMRKAPLPGESPLVELQLQPTEASLIDNDLRSFPNMGGKPVREDLYSFTDGEQRLDVMNVNATTVESATGVDLVYLSRNYDCFVLVQYKRMETNGGTRIAAIDARLPDQLKRMVRFDSFGRKFASTTDPAAFRLGAGSTFTKFAYPVASPLKESDLTRGLYVPSELLKRLHDVGQLVGPRGGAAVTHKNLGRWLSNDQFADLVKKGWVGSSGVSVQDVKNFISASLRESRIAVVAAHASTANDN
ncbi:hypothetical protein [Nesterenkonia populi]|uniref:hypothetical protein n=1 Tax=Nesterenkonia populi TaxID=1591087 RepID=UPI0011BF75CC|nr:hypothetical protein [Nesterenkonia populi]